MTYNPPPRMICATCHRPLDAFETPDGTVTYHHAIIPSATFGPCDNLDPIAVGDDVGDTIGVCDFCSAPLPRWNYPTTDFQLPGSVPALGMMSQGAWGACDSCHDLIEAGDYDRLSEVSLRNFPGTMRPLLRDSIRAMHAGFRSHRSGAAVELWNLTP